MVRVMLYYPTIIIPEYWQKGTILYFDTICSIVPKAWEDEVNDRPSILNEHERVSYDDMKYLEGLEQYRSIKPSGGYFEKAPEFEREFKDIIMSSKFRSKIDPNWERKGTISKVHKEKFFYEIENFLADQNLLITNKIDSQWGYFEEKTALLYMALLAKYLSNNETDKPIPSTDSEEYQKLTYETSLFGDSFVSFSADLLNILPMPKRNVKMNKIIKFKRRNEMALLSFRDVLDKLESDLANANNENEIRKIQNRYQDKLKFETMKLDASMRDYGIETVLASLKSLIDIKSPALLETLGALGLGFIQPHIGIPLIAATATVQLGYTLISNWNKRSAALRDKSYSYLYQAKRAGIIDI